MSKHSSSVIVWLRQDLRIQDNPALYEASQLKIPLIPIYIWSDDDQNPWQIQGASQWWLHQSLKSLERQFESLGSKLIIKHGLASEVLKSLCAQTKASHIFWNRCYEPHIVKRDQQIKKTLQNLNLSVQSFNSSLLSEPWDVLNREDQPYKVFTSYWNACLKNSRPREPYPPVRKLVAPKKWPKSSWPQSLVTLSECQWTKKLKKVWQPGEKQARLSWQNFLSGHLEEYGNQRDFPAVEGTSSLSAHIRFGEISPHQVYFEATQKSQRQKNSKAQLFLRQLAWRDFAYSILFHYPSFAKKSYRDEFSNYPWKKNKKYFEAWCQGHTGLPIVDAGMRQLWQTGWMHNRVRMIVGSFLTKNLNVHWLHGAQWFWQTLVDADLANNSFGWQWVAGCGLDAAPFFRIFNPVLQGEKFDPHGLYVKEYVPELKELPAKWIHQPWLAPADLSGYPSPLVDLKETRKKALENYKSLKVLQDSI